MKVPTLAMGLVSITLLSGCKSPESMVPGKWVQKFGYTTTTVNFTKEGAWDYAAGVPGQVPYTMSGTWKMDGSTVVMTVDKYRGVDAKLLRDGIENAVENAPASQQEFLETTLIFLKTGIRLKFSDDRRTLSGEGRFHISKVDN